jgi:acetyl esterase/lipase
MSGVWIEPVPDLIAGEIKILADTASVEAIRVPGYWIHKNGSNVKIDSPPIAGEKVVYNLHGGAYVRCSAHPSDMTANIPRGILKFAESVHRTFSVEYRLSSTRPFAIANPFPSALIDAIAGYSYLVNDVGFSPADIIVTGDSAGGNLAHALTRYLVENQNSSIDKLPPPPGGLVLFSPWCDASDSHDVPGSSTFIYRTTDFITPDHGSFAKRAFLGPHGLEEANINRYISPACRYPSLSIDFKGFPRTLITAGGVEILIDQIRLMRARMVDDLGEGDGVEGDEGKVQYFEEPDALHDYAIFKWHEPERSNTLKEVARWIAVAAS